MLRGLSWKIKHWTMVYDTTLLAKWYWVRQRGLANSGQLERLILAWKGQLPAGLAKEWRHVDVGSKLYSNVMMKVPVAAPKDLAFVEKAVREQSLSSMVGASADLGGADFGAADQSSAPPEALAPPEEDEGPPVPNPAPFSEGLVKHVKKRRLYRQTTGDEVVWFPHDNSPTLLKELVWESGSATRWVLHGTPSGSTGISGILEMGVSVVVFCRDTHHADHLQRFLKERCVELLLTGSLVFSDLALRNRADEVLGVLGKEKESKKDTPKANKNDKDKKKDAKEQKKEKKKEKKEKDEEGKKKEKDEDGKKKKEKDEKDEKDKVRKRKKRKAGSSSNSSSSSSNSSSSNAQKDE